MEATPTSSSTPISDRAVLGTLSRAMPVAAAEVLVVDDMATVRLMLAQYVKQLGHNVTAAANGEEALEQLRQRDFDLVLLDVMMPGMDGYSVLETIKGDPSLRDIPVVMVSGLDEVESVVRCIERGAEDYLAKPFNPTLLRARVNACLEKKRLWDELRQKYQQLQELEKLRDSLTHMVVHDLRTPLTSLLTGLYTLEALGELGEEQREFWELGVAGGETLLGMINDLLDISKMEAGALTLGYSNPSVPILVERAVQQVAYLAREKGQSLSAEVEPDLPRLTVDEDKVRRTLVNLLGNAIKFTPHGGQISLAVCRGPEPHILECRVQDTGEGIPSEAFDRIFEKFGQVESRKAGRVDSTGLGLTFCKMAVEAHGGRIWVESEPGQGSCFRFTLPVSPGVGGLERG